MVLELTDLDESGLLADAEALMSSIVTPLPRSSPQDAASDSAGSNESVNKTLSQTEDVQRRRMYRQRQKNERQDLQRQEAELTHEIARFHQARHDEMMKLEMTRLPSYFMWKAIAMRQLDERLLAEEEQRHLVRTMNAQAIYIQALSAATDKRFLAERGHTHALAKRDDVMRTETALFRAYIEQLEAHYAQIDEVFEKSGLWSLPESETVAHSVQMRESDGEVEYFQRLNKYVEPSPLYDTAISLWEMGKKMLRQRGDHEPCAVVSSSENVLVMKFRETGMLQAGTKVSLLQHYVVRRWFEWDRVVHVWKLVTQGEGAFSGMCMEETGWATLRPTSNATVAETQIEMCVRKSPMHFKTPILHENTAQQFHEVMQNLSDETVGEVMHSLEKLLLEDTVLVGQDHACEEVDLKSAIHQARPKGPITPVKGERGD
ncbi:hypothetical protein PHYBOEH_004513 [Phytophthora boehmeriae]|uniref:M96 mating-specific protein family n=1 Tax=Phytophthora boehmeriae TaxID=109152 RepID=A0A8T1WSZ8_9STRA|nr:hypothetical protein PHYBOEH_004513 [Phytophthora boehmeriae]